MTGRVALISGSNRGIGLAIADRLAAEGWSLSLGARQPSSVPEHHRHQHIQAYDADTVGGESVWVASAMERFGRIDAVVNNAGIMVPKSVIDVEDAEMQAMINVNVLAPMRLVRSAWPYLGKSGRGRVVTIVSLSGKRVKYASSGAYSVSKYAALAMAHAFRHAGWDLGIRSTAICPGLVATDMSAGLTNMPPADMTSPDDIAQLVSVVLNLPNVASVAEIPVNCNYEESY